MDAPSERLSRRSFFALAATSAIVWPSFAQDKKKPAPKPRARTTRRTPTSKPTSTIAPLEPPPPGGETVAYAIKRLRHGPASELRGADLALLAGLDFCTAIADADAARASHLLDATGYQPLPVEGPLPLDPPRLLLPAHLKEALANRRGAPIGEVLLERFSVQRMEAVRAAFPAVADWMLPDDFALVVEPDAAARFVLRRACVVVRVRGRRPAIVGGNLLEALDPPVR